MTEKRPHWGWAALGLAEAAGQERGWGGAARESKLILVTLNVIFVGEVRRKKEKRREGERRGEEKGGKERGRRENWEKGEDGREGSVIGLR